MLVSQNLSQKPKESKNNAEHTRDPEKQCCNRGQCSETALSCSSSVPRTQDFLRLLCYSCRVTVNDVTSVSTFPPYILQEAEHRSRRLEMRREIQEFLLDEVSGDM